jgi:hypothetical protein
MRSVLGNGWAAAGMLRVLGTIKNSQYAHSMKNEQTDLTNWVKEIQGGMYGVLVSLRAAFSFSNHNDITHRRISGFNLAVQKLS